MNGYLLFASIWFASAVAPGADTMLLLSRAVAGGWKATVPYWLGIALAKTTMLTLAYFGLTAVIMKSPGAFIVLKLFGTAFLLWLAWKSWQAKDATPRGSRDGFWPGLATSYAVGVSNPQAAVFYIAVVPQVAATTNVWLLNLIVVAGFTGITAIYVLLAKPVRSWLTTSGNQHRLNRVVAVIYVLLAIVVALR